MPTTTAPTPKTLTTYWRWLLVLIALVGAALVGRAPSADATTYSFTDVGGVGGIMSVGTWFTYKGPGPVTLTVTDGLGYKAAQVSALKGSATGTWYLQANGLDSGTPYHIRLDSPTSRYISPTTY